MLGGALGGGVGQQAGGRTADAGQDADAQTDEGGLDDVAPVGQVLLGGDAHHLTEDAGKVVGVLVAQALGHLVDAQAGGAEHLAGLLHF